MRPLHSLSVGIIFVSYALHVRFLPFLDPIAPEAVQLQGRRGAAAHGVQLIYVRGVGCFWPAGVGLWLKFCLARRVHGA